MQYLNFYFGQNLHFKNNTFISTLKLKLFLLLFVNLHLNLNRDLLLSGSGIWSNLPENIAVGADNAKEESKATSDNERDEDQVIHQSGPQVDQEDVGEAGEDSPTEDKNL